MKHHERVSFNQASDILEHAIEYLAHVDGLLAAAAQQDPSERVRLLLASFQKDQKRLREALERYVEDASDKVLNTFTQTSLELPAELEGPPLPLSTLALTQWLEALNRHLVVLFREVGDSSGSGDVRAVFTGLANQVDAHQRKLSKEYQRFEDL